MAKILLVDDSPSERAIIGEIIKGCGHECVVAEDGEQGVAKAKSEAGLSMIIMDIVMPNKDGLGALRDIVGDNPAAYSGPPIVMCSTKSDRATIFKAENMSGAKGYVVKPLTEKANRAQLVAFIKQFAG